MRSKRRLSIVTSTPQNMPRSPEKSGFDTPVGDSAVHTISQFGSPNDSASSSSKAQFVQVIQPTVLLAFQKSDEDGDGLLSFEEWKSFLLGTQVLFDVDGVIHERLAKNLYALADTLSIKEINLELQDLNRLHTDQKGNVQRRRGSIVSAEELNAGDLLGADGIRGISLQGANQTVRFVMEQHTVKDPKINRIISEVKAHRISSNSSKQQSSGAKLNRIITEGDKKPMRKNADLPAQPKYESMFTRDELEMHRFSRWQTRRHEIQQDFEQKHPFHPALPPDPTQKFDPNSGDVSVTSSASTKLLQKNRLGTRQYRQFDPRDSDERLLSQCTFRPRVQESPFLSPKAMGGASSRLSSRFWPKSRPASSAELESISIPLFFVDPQNRPAFLQNEEVLMRAWTRSVMLTYEVASCSLGAPSPDPAEEGEEGEDEEEGSAACDAEASSSDGCSQPTEEKEEEEEIPVYSPPPPPALPPWAFSETAPSSPEPSSLRPRQRADDAQDVPTRSRRHSEPVVNSGSMWDQVMKEMQARTGSEGAGLKKKAEPKVGKLKVQKRRRRATSTGGFSDVIDELSERLAFLRGEGPSPGEGEEEEEEEEEDDVYGLAITKAPFQSSQDIDTPTDSGEATSENFRFRKYRIMQRSSLPEGAIRQKMMMDGLTEEEQNGFFKEGTQTDGQIPPVTPGNTSRAQSNGVSADKVRVYSTMRKCGLPEAAVRQRMTMDGLSDAVQDGFFAQRINESVPEDRGGEEGRGGERVPSSTAVTPGTPLMDFSRGLSFLGMAPETPHTPLAPRSEVIPDPPRLGSVRRCKVVRVLPGSAAPKVFTENFGFLVPHRAAGEIPFGVYIWSNAEHVAAGKLGRGGTLIGDLGDDSETQFIERGFESIELEPLAGPLRMQEQEAVARSMYGQSTLSMARSELDKSGLGLLGLSVNTTAGSTHVEGKLRIEDLPEAQGMGKWMEHMRRSHQARQEYQKRQAQISMRGEIPGTEARVGNVGGTGSTWTGKRTEVEAFRFEGSARLEQKTHTFRKGAAVRESAHHVDYENSRMVRLTVDGTSEKILGHSASDAYWLTSLRDQISHEDFTAGGARSDNQKGSPESKCGFDRYNVEMSLSVPFAHSSYRENFCKQRKVQREIFEERRKLWEAERVKARKQSYRKSAIATAKSGGAFSPTPRNNYLRKTVARYSGRKDVGLDLINMTRSAYANFINQNAN